MRRALLLPALLAATPAYAALNPHQVAQAVARPAPDARLPARLAFTDLAGGRVTLGAAADGRPTLLLFVDFTCRHICGPGMTLTAGALHDLHLRPGRDLSFVVIGMDARDSAAQAREMAEARLASMPDMLSGVRILRGDAATVARAEKALGYTAIYDPATDQFAHDASLYVFAPDGRVSALLPEVALLPPLLRAAIENAGKGAPPPSFAERVAALCYGFAPAHGRYAQPIAIALRLGGVLLLVAMALALLRMRRRDA